MPESYPLPRSPPVGPDGEISPSDSEDSEHILGEGDFDTLGESILDDAHRADCLPIDIEAQIAHTRPSFII